MVQAKSLYITLRDDPDLDIPEGENRESAAWNEMTQRVRQHKSNSKALAMGSESSVEKFMDFIEKGLKAKAGESWENYVKRAEKNLVDTEKLLERHPNLIGHDQIVEDIASERAAISVVAASGTGQEQNQYMRDGSVPNALSTITGKEYGMGKPEHPSITRARLEEYENKIKEKREAEEREANKLTPEQQEIADKVKALNPREIGSATAREIGKSRTRNPQTHNIISVEINGEKILFSRQLGKRPDSGRQKDTSPFKRKFASDRSITMTGPANDFLRNWIEPHIDPDTGQEHKFIPDELAKQLKENPGGNKKVTYSNTPENRNLIQLIHQAFLNIEKYTNKRQDALVRSGHIKEEGRGGQHDISHRTSSEHEEISQRVGRGGDIDPKTGKTKPRSKLTAGDHPARKETLATALRLFAPSAAELDSDEVKEAADKAATYRPINGMNTRIVGSDGGTLGRTVSAKRWEDHDGISRDDIISVLDVAVPKDGEWQGISEETLNEIGKLLANPIAGTQDGVPHADAPLPAIGTDTSKVNNATTLPSGKEIERRRGVLIGALDRAAKMEDGTATVDGHTANKYLHHDPTIAGRKATEMHEHNENALKATGVVHPELQETIHEALDTLRRHYDENDRTSDAARDFKAPADLVATGEAAARPPRGYKWETDSDSPETAKTGASWRGAEPRIVPTIGGKTTTVDDKQADSEPRDAYIGDSAVGEGGRRFLTDPTQTGSNKLYTLAGKNVHDLTHEDMSLLAHHLTNHPESGEILAEAGLDVEKIQKYAESTRTRADIPDRFNKKEHVPTDTEERKAHSHRTAHSERRNKANGELSKWITGDKKKWVENEENSDAIKKEIETAANERRAVQDATEEAIKHHYLGLSNNWKEVGDVGGEPVYAIRNPRGVKGKGRTTRYNRKQIMEMSDEDLKNLVADAGRGESTPKERLAELVAGRTARLEKDLKESRETFEENEKENESQYRTDAETGAYFNVNSRKIATQRKRMHGMHNQPLRDEEKTSHSDSKMMATHDAARKEVEDVTTEKIPKKPGSKDMKNNPNYIPEGRRVYVSSETPPLGTKIYPGLTDKSATWFDKEQAEGLKQIERDRHAAASAAVQEQTKVTAARHQDYFAGGTIRQTSGLPQSLPTDTIIQNSLIQKSFLIKEIDDEQEEAYFEEKDYMADEMVKNGVAASHKVALKMLTHIADGGIDDHKKRMDNLSEAHDKVLAYHEKMGGHPFQEDDAHFDAHKDNILNDTTEHVEGHDPSARIIQTPEKSPETPPESPSERIGSKTESKPVKPKKTTKKEDPGAQRIDTTKDELTGKEFDKLTSTDHGKEVLAHMYEETHGKGNPFTSEEAHKAALRAKYIKNPTSTANDMSKKWNAAQKKKATATKTADRAEAAQAKSDTNLQSGVLERNVNTLLGDQSMEQKRNRKGLTAKAARALLDKHDGDRGAAEKSITDKWAKEDAANKLPEGLDSPEAINEGMFGTPDPNAKFAGLHPTRNENRNGVKATTMARDLLAHFEEHQHDMSPETRKKLVSALSHLNAPHTANKKFEGKRGERYADLKAARGQIEELREKGISPTSDEGKALLADMDKKLGERTRNFEANHISTKEDHENNSRIWDHGNSNHTHQFDEEGNSTGRTRHNADSGEREAHEGEDVRHSRVKEHHENLSDIQSSNLNAVHAAHEVHEDARGKHSDETRKLLSDSHKADRDVSNATEAIERHEESQKKGLRGEHGRVARAKRLESADKVRQAETNHEKAQSERDQIQSNSKEEQESAKKRTQAKIKEDHKAETTKRIAELVSQQTSMTGELEDQVSADALSDVTKKHTKALDDALVGINKKYSKDLAGANKRLRSAKTELGDATGAHDDLNQQHEDAKKFRETKEGRYGSKNINKWKEEHAEAQGRQQQSESALSEAGVSSDDIQEHHTNKDQVNRMADKFSESLDEGQKTGDYMHSEDEHDELTTGPPDPEIAKQMMAQGYEWHEDTRRWRHKETHDDHVKANGAGNGTLTAGNHSASGGAHGYMATASMGADGKVTATPDTGNFSITPAGTHRVSSNLGGNPPTSPQGIQSHKLGHAMNNAGISHNGTSSTFNLKHLNSTGMQNSKNWKPPKGMTAAKAGGATQRSRFLEEAGYNKSGNFHQAVVNAPKVATGLINRALGRNVGKSLDLDSLSSVELLKLHIALQEEKDRTRV